MTFDEDYQECTPLTGKRAAYTSEFVTRNFYAMSISFALGHGCMVSCLAYAAAELGSSMGGVSSGILYVVYAFTALLLSKPIVAMTGAKISLIVSLIGTCIYVCGFCLALISLDISNDVAWVLATISAFIGGLAAGVIWTAQGRIFTHHSKVYAEVNRISVERSNIIFAAVFSTAFLGLEMLLKLFGTVTYLIFPSLAAYVIFTIYAALALLACFLSMSIDELGDEGTGQFSYPTISKEAGAVAKMVWMDARLALLVPFAIAIGFASSFVPLYIFGSIITNDSRYGSTYVGLFSSVVVFVGAAFSMPAAWASNAVGKETLIYVGGVCVTLVGGMLFIFTDSQLAEWSHIFPYLCIVGLARLTWENTNKAVIADIWVSKPEDSTSAFAAISFFNGYAAAMGYFIFPFCERNGMAGTVFITGIAGSVCYFFALRVHDSRIAELPPSEKKAIAHRQYWDQRHEVERSKGDSDIVV